MWAFDQPIFIAIRASSQLSFVFLKHLPAAIAVRAWQKPCSPAPFALRFHIPNRKSHQQLRQFAVLIQLFDLLSAADVLPPYEHLRQTHRLPSNGSLQLFPVRRIHGNVSFIHRNSEASEDCANRTAVFVGFPNSSQAREVDYHFVLSAGETEPAVGERRTQRTGTD